MGRSPHTVGRLASGDGRLYHRLAAGRDITTRRAARVVQWLSDHWPAGAEWPSDIPRPAPTPGGDPEPPAGGAGSSPVLLPAPPGAGLPARGGPSSASTGPAGGGDPNPPAATCAHDGAAAADTRPPGPDGRVRNSGAPDAAGGPSSAAPAASLKPTVKPKTGLAITAPSAGAAVPSGARVRAQVQAWHREMCAAMERSDWAAAHAIEERMQALATTLRPDGRIASPAALVLVLGIDRGAYEYVVRRYAHGRRPTHGIHEHGPTARVLRALTAAGDVRFTRQAA